MTFYYILSETVLKFKALKKPAQLAVINSLEKVCAPIYLYSVLLFCVYVLVYYYILHGQRYVDTPSNEWFWLFQPHQLLTGEP
jgi:hypothetical protein